MPLIDLVTSVCDEIGLPAPAAVATGTDQLARQMFALANTSLKDISKRFDWPVLVREYSFLTVNGTAEYALPANYKRLIGFTAFNATQYYELRGSVSPDEWQYTKQQNLSSLDRAKIRVYGSPLKLYVQPTPTTAETYVYEYLTKNRVTDNAAAEQLVYQNDTDTSIVDEELVKLSLKWRIKHAKGLEFSVDLADCEEQISTEYARALSAPPIQIGGRVLDTTLTSGYVRDNGFGA